MRDFLSNYSRNFNRISEIKFIGKGIEGTVYGVEPFIPIEAVIKLSNSNISKLSLLRENHFLNLIYHGDYICKVLEEILIYD